MPSIRLAAAVLLACLSAFAQAQSAAQQVTYRAQCSAATCHVKIIFVNGKPTVDIEELQVVKGNRNASIVWHLPSGFVFDAAQGDGVMLKAANDGQFDNQYATDDDNGGASAARRGRNFHWRSLNTKKGSYGYNVRFRDGSGNLYLFDPIIMNDG